MSKFIPCRWGFGSYVQFSDHIRSPSDKSIPLSKTGRPHNCHLSPYYQSLKSVKDRAIQIQAIEKIDDYSLLQEARKNIEDTNSRLNHFKLVLTVIEKRPEKEVKELSN
jgi:hypothetical protein